MKNASASTILPGIILVLAVCVQQGIAISCYVCTGTTTVSTDNPCLPPLDSSKTCNNVTSASSLTDCVSVVSGCDNCLTSKTTIPSGTTYVRTCSTVGASTLANKCETENSVTTCVSSCSKELCNTGSDAVRLQVTTLSILSILCLAQRALASASTMTS